MKRKIPLSHIKKIILEMIPVVLGIWIALWANNWNENKKDRNFLQKVMQSVQTENEMNLNELGVVQPNQLILLDSINRNIHNKQVSILQILSRTGGFKIPSIKNNSWQALANSKPELLDYEILKILSDIEGEQKNLEEKVHYATSFLYQNLNAREEDEKVIFKVLLSDILDSENQLKKHLVHLKSVY